MIYELKCCTQDVYCPFKIKAKALFICSCETSCEHETVKYVYSEKRRIVKGHGIVGNAFRRLRNRVDELEKSFDREKAHIKLNTNNIYGLVIRINELEESHKNLAALVK